MSLIKFITRVFNPVLPSSPLGDKLTALGGLLNALKPLICPKEVEASSFSLWRYRIYIEYGCSGCWFSWKCCLCDTSQSAKLGGGGGFTPQFLTFARRRLARIIGSSPLDRISAPPPRFDSSASVLN